MKGTAASKVPERLNPLPSRRSGGFALHLARARRTTLAAPALRLRENGVERRILARGQDGEAVDQAGDLGPVRRLSAGGAVPAMQRQARLAPEPERLARALEPVGEDDLGRLERPELRRHGRGPGGAYDAEPGLAGAPGEVDEEAPGRPGLFRAAEDGEAQVGLVALEDAVDELVLAAAIGVTPGLEALRQPLERGRVDGVARLRIGERLPGGRRRDEDRRRNRSRRRLLRRLMRQKRKREHDRGGAERGAQPEQPAARPPAGRPGSGVVARAKR